MTEQPEKKRIRDIDFTENPGSTLLGTASGLVMCLLGYAIFHDSTGALMLGMFVFMPAVVGLVVGLVTPQLNQMLASVIMATILAYAILWLFWLEGIICVIMAYPITFVVSVVGGLVGAIIHRLIFRRMPRGSRLPVVLGLLAICPFLAGAVNHFEQPYRDAKAYETFASQVDLPVGIDDAWRVLAELDGLDGPQPLLVRMGLPLPQRCELEYQGPGARRICHFNQGRIDQTVRVWQPPLRMEIDVDGSTLPGRAWLGFDSAAYRLEVIDDQTTRLTRTTTITTRLGPRWYWRPLERWGVTSEHQYVLDNLKRQAMKVAQQ